MVFAQVSELFRYRNDFRRPAAWAERPRAFPGRSGPQASGPPAVNRTAAIYWLRPAPIARLA
jgi:hypothetical protein